MEACMIECTRKLAIWYTRTFKPIMTHEELEPIMATLGFTAQPETPAVNGVAWKEYLYVASGYRSLSPDSPLPKPKLPCQLINGRRRIDGLHIYTYRAFIDAVNFYLEMEFISDVFHVRGMPLQAMFDRNKKFRRMDENGSVFVYKGGTLDQASFNQYHKNNNVDSSNDEHSSIIIRNKGNDISIGKLVPLKDIIVFMGFVP
ncbi:uncharacterized protein LOC110737896 [Chenopodium quinoa]|uniref:uncharacterized protein LOC110737896 n=1 Tax=Chenopodium quinoa TaxID=63459 RepID=UPI000B7718EB|nr:uncharacterized protein LOC110737896 [Chenopodium quinoa]